MAFSHLFFMKLVIAEKPSVARTIGSVLGATKPNQGYVEGNGWIVSWCFGHLAEYATPDVYDEKYRQWNFDDLPIIPQEWQLTIAKDKNEQYGILKKLLNRDDMEFVVNACDAGREGELIFRHVYELSGSKLPIKRLWISSMEDSAVLDGFNHLKSGQDYELLERAAKCRAQADWLVGMNATRAYTSKYYKKLTVGRVQTPTLNMIVERQKQIDEFQKKPYWTVSLSSNGLKVLSDQLDVEANADQMVSQCQGKDGIVTKADRVQKKTMPPRLYDLTTLQREANRLFGYTAKKTLDLVQSLYENKLVTYPRTDSQYITDDMEDTVLEILEKLPKQVPCLVGLNIGRNVKRTINNSKVSDHTALLPTVESVNKDISKLPEEEFNIYSLIAQRLASAVSDECLYQDTQVVVQCEGYEFKARGKTITSPGWRAIGDAFAQSVKGKNKKTDKDKKDEDEEDTNAVIPDWVVQGASVPNVQAEKKQHFTAPPKPYTEDTLLSAMETAGNKEFDKETEKKGLGTPATRAGIIEKLIKSNVPYAKRKGKQILPTEDGKALIEVVTDTVKSPSMTAEWENSLLHMERGEVDPDEWMNGIYTLLNSILGECEQISGDESYRFYRQVKESIGKCPVCGADVYETKNNFSCSNKDCMFVLWKNNKYLQGMKKDINITVAKDLLKDGKTHMKGLYSKRTGKTFDADLIMGIDESGRPSFSLDFANNNKYSKNSKKS